MPGWFELGCYAALLACVVLLAPMLGQVAARWRAANAYPFQIDTEEGFILEQAIRLRQGRTIYHDLGKGEPPWLVGNYTPLFPAALGLAHGTQVTPGSMRVGRVMTEGCALGVMALLAWVVWRRTRRWPPALLAPCLFAASYEVHQWSVFVRADFPALLLTWAGLALFLEGRRRWMLAVSALFFVAAVYTKQTAVIAPLACAAALAIWDRGRLAWFLGPLAGAGLAMLGILQWLTDGQFWLHTVAYNANEMDWWAWRQVMKNELLFFYRFWLLGLVMIAGAFGVYLLPRPRPAGFDPKELKPEAGAAEADGADGGEGDRSPARAAWRPRHSRGVMPIYAALAGLSLLSVAKVGSAANYFLEPLAAAAWLACEGIGRLMDAARRDEGAGKEAIVWVRRGIVAAVIAVMALHGMRVGQLTPIMASSGTPSAADRAVMGQLPLLLRATEGAVMADEPVLSMLAGKAVFYEPFIMKTLAVEGKWSQAPMLAMLSSGELARIVVGDDLTKGGQEEYLRWTPEFAQTVIEYYEVERFVHARDVNRWYWVWKYKGAGE